MLFHIGILNEVIHILIYINMTQHKDFHLKEKYEQFYFIFLFFLKLVFYFKSIYKSIYYTILIHTKKSKNKFSVIIPTMYKSDYLHKLVAELNSCDAVLEILLIDNANKNGSDLKQYEKVKVLNQVQNIYVNPAWNLGASEAKSEYLMIANDDILIDVNILKKILIALDQNIGIIGMDDTRNNIKLLKINLAKIRLKKFGTLMFMHKSNYKRIPDELLIWHGDDYLFHAVDKFNCSISGFRYETKMSSTSNIGLFHEIKLRDNKIFNEKYRDHFGEYLVKSIQFK